MSIAAYPVVRAGSAPAVGPKLRHHHFLSVVGTLLVVIVVAVTASAVLTRVTPQLCHLSCGPDVGPSLAVPSAYTSSQYGYRVEYDSSTFVVSSHGPSSVQLVVPTSAANLVAFSATAGSNVSGAMSSAIGQLNTNVIQGLQAIGSVPGAEIGLVSGAGEAYSATFVPPNGGQSYPVSVVAMAATRGNLTLSVVAIGQQDLSSVADLPFGLANGGLLDGPVTDTIWPARR